MGDINKFSFTYTHAAYRSCTKNKGIDTEETKGGDRIPNNKKGWGLKLNQLSEAIKLTLSKSRGKKWTTMLLSRRRHYY